jgi:hypothetical protein
MGLLACLALAGAVGIALGGEEDASILGNGGFESPAPGKDGPAGWSATRVPHTKDMVVLGWDDRVARSGSRSVSIAIAEAHPDQRIDYSWNRPVTGFEPGTTYRVTGWVRAEGLKSTAFIVVQCWDRAFKKMLGFATTQGRQEVVGTTDWTRLACTVDVPPGTGRIMLLAGIGAPDNRGGRVWFDDLAMVPASGGAED